MNCGTHCGTGYALYILILFASSCQQTRPECPHTYLPASLSIKADRGLSVPAGQKGRRRLKRQWGRFLQSSKEPCWTGGGGIQGASSKKPNFDGLAHLVDENFNPPYKIDVLWKIGGTPNSVSSSTRFHTWCLLGSWPPWRVPSFWLSTEFAYLLVGGRGGGEEVMDFFWSTSFGRGYAVKTAMSD